MTKTGSDSALLLAMNHQAGLVDTEDEYKVGGNAVLLSHFVPPSVHHVVYY